MKIINTDVRGWKHEQGQYITGEGLILSKKQIKEQCEYSAVPTTLVNIDDRYGLDTTLQVLRATSTGIERLLVTDDEKQVLSVLDPRSKFTPDDEFHSLIENIKNKGYEDVKIANTGGSIRATFETPANDTDSVLGGHLPSPCCRGTNGTGRSVLHCGSSPIGLHQWNAGS